MTVLFIFNRNQFCFCLPPIFQFLFYILLTNFTTLFLHVSVLVIFPIYYLFVVFIFFRVILVRKKCDLTQKTVTVIFIKNLHHSKLSENGKSSRAQN